MRLQDNIDFTTLTWVKGELDETLKQARHALEAYVEDPADDSQMRFCATYLHQVQGTLRMVELYGAAMATEEMEQLATALLGDQVRDRDDAYAVLMRGIVQLPDYLERLQGGHKDIPIVLLPLVNELRVARGEQALVESALFTPDLSRPLPPTARGPARPLAEAELRRQAEPLRVQFQMALLQWFRNNDPDAQLGKLTHVCDTLIAITHEEEARRLFWVAAGVIEALRARAFEPSAPLKQAIGKVEREIKRLCDAGEIGFRVDPPRELTRALLYYVAHAPADHGRLGELRHIFNLDALVPTNEELEHARGSMTGHNRALLSTVGAAIKDDLLRVKDALDLHMRSRTVDATSLGAQIEILDRVGDTLGMLGLGVPRRVVNEQRQVLQQVVAGGRAADEATLLDVAGALLYVEASLDDQVQHLGASSRDGEAADTRALPQAESRKVLDALVQEAQANFAQAKQCFVAFIESNWDHAQLADVPRLLEEVAGALRILELDEPPRYLESVRRFTAFELIERKRVPNGPQMDTLADVLASLEYYLEALREQRSGRERILETTRVSLERLGYWPIPEYRAAPIAKVVTPATMTTAVPFEPEAEEKAPAPVGYESAEGFASDELADAELQHAIPGEGIVELSTPSDGAGDATAAASAKVITTDFDENRLGHFMLGFEDTGEDIDEEIREVFVEEVQEEISNLGDLLPHWQKDPSSVETLKPIRRVFHTLKGSGRLVGAMTLGEFSWKVESMLNRVLDRTIEPWPEVIDLVSAAYRELPELLTALRGEPTRRVDLEGIKSIADRLAMGERVAYVAPVFVASLSPVVEAAPVSVAPVIEALPEMGEIEEFASGFGAAATAAPVTALEVEAEHASEVESQGTPFVIDSVLFEILTTEVAGHLETLDEYIAACGRGATVANEKVLRAVHTMSGAFAMTEVPHIGEVVGPLESYIKRLLARGESPSREGEEVIAEAANAVRQLLRGLNADHPSAPAFPALAERVAGLRDTLPEPQGPLLPLHADTADERAESANVERLEAERIEAERVEARRVEADRIESERVEAERIEAERVESERVEAERIEAEHVEAERVEAEHVEAERVEAERVEAERVEAERVEAERVEAERVEAERVELELLEAELLESERLEAELIAQAREEEALMEAELLAMELAESATSEVPVAAATLAQVTAKAPVEDADADPDLPLDIVDLDEELLDIFLEESTDILDHSDGLLARVRAEPEEREHVVGLQRDLHTLKGGARMAGIMPIGDLGHVMESLLEAVAEGRREFGNEGMEVLEQAFDRLHRMVIRVGERRALAMPNRLIQRLEALVRGEVFVSRAPLETVQPALGKAELESLRPSAPAAVVAVAPAQPPSSLLSIETAIDEEDSGVRAPQEQIRIRADLLDRLVNYAGEVAIYRARLEQQVGAFRGGLFEMDQTTSRLREQLRRLDIETEAQIIARYQREGDDNDREFDPLELDRFSNLQQLSRALAESAADLTSLQSTLEELTRQYDTLLLQQSRVSSDLQEGLMRTRMVPFESLVPRLRRIIRQTSGELGKRVQLRVEGAQGEMDRSVLDRMTAPLEHMLRNALAHGLETADERRAVGKPEEGLVRIVIGREGSEVVIRVSDDGRGINRDAIRRKALERGLMEPSAQLSDRDLYGFILQAGFSTAETVSKIAGRGVGLDVVSSEIRQLGGSLHIESEYGKGTEFVVRLPFTLAVTQAVFVKLGETQFAVPMASVQGVARIAPADLEAQLATGNPTFEYAGERYAIYDLGRLLGHAHVRAAETLQVPLLLARSGDQRAAISIDAVIGGREIVVKPTGPQINSIPGIFGATVMGDGSVVVILDVAPLVRRAAAMQLSGEALPPVAEMPAARKVPLVMVVDDSITMRKVTGRVLERSGYEVGAAKDGLDAIEKMQERVPDVMLLDIEMPRMDGYELATHMRNDSRLRGVPIIMITSRTGEKHRQRAFEIGVDRYLGKPYQEAELLRNVEEILRVGRG